MFADQVVEGMSDLMFVGTGIAKRAMAFSKGLAIRTAGIKAESILTFEEVAKGKMVLRRQRRRHKRWSSMIHGQKS